MQNYNIVNFKGFYKESFLFLQNLSRNNNKPWFIENKDEYDKYLLIPLKQLVILLEPFILDIDNKLVTKPVINKSISRIYRDTRFSKRKTPFKSRIRIMFRANVKHWKTLPSFFFELQSNSYSYGMGLFNAKPYFMEKFRYSIDRNKKAFLNSISPLEKNNNLMIWGEDYKKQFYKGNSSKIKFWYQKRGIFIFSKNKVNEDIFSYRFLDYLRNITLILFLFIII